MEQFAEKMRAGEMREVDVTWEWEDVHGTVGIEFEQWHSGVLIVVDWES